MRKELCTRPNGAMRLLTMVGRLCVLAALVVACTRREPAMVRSAYYWSTVYNLPPAAISTRHVARLYMRYFDVVRTPDGTAMPNATLRFARQVPKGVEVVPVVFIVNDVMRGNTATLAPRILKRIVQMNAANGMPAPREIQIDCDWTRSTRPALYAFMAQLRQLARLQGIGLSATIRLHQLSQAPPPADRGVLMVYNTGDFRDLANADPILHMRDVQPYLPHLARYPLPLVAAYPNFAYRLLFRHGRFVGIVHRKGEYASLPSNSIVVRQSSLQQVLKVKHALARKRPDIHREIIIYDLKTTNRHDEEIYTR